MKLYLRLFVECSNLHEAHDMAARLCGPLSKLHLRSADEPKIYWKIPELFEFSYQLASATREDYDRVVSGGGNGWLHMDDLLEPCSVWNRSEGTMLFIDGVTWAEVTLMR
jgi:hypothetical protein